MRAPGRDEAAQKNEGQREDERAGFGPDQRARNDQGEGRGRGGEDRGGPGFDRQGEIDRDPGAEEDRRPGEEMPPLFGENARGPGSFAMCCAEE